MIREPQFRFTPTAPNTLPMGNKPSRRRRVRPIPDELRCQTCGDERAIRWRGAWHCVVCDVTALFPAVHEHRQRVARIAEGVAR